jgi:hypothetical protein
MKAVRSGTDIHEGQGAVDPRLHPDRRGDVGFLAESLVDGMQAPHRIEADPVECHTRCGGDDVGAIGVGQREDIARPNAGLFVFADGEHVEAIIGDTADQADPHIEQTTAGIDEIRIGGMRCGMRRHQHAMQFAQTHRLNVGMVLCHAVDLLRHGHHPWQAS